MSGNDRALSEELRQATAVLLERLCAEHRLAPVPKLEWSVRMRRMLGRAYVDRGFIRLSAWLDGDQAADTLRHELAHMAATSQASQDGRRRQAPHGPRWRAWAERLGVDPRATAHTAPAAAPARSNQRRYWGLECPNCGVRLARMRMLRGLYHRDCGPRKGRLVRVFRDRREIVYDWVAATPPAIGTDEPGAAESLDASQGVP